MGTYCGMVTGGKHGHHHRFGHHRGFGHHHGCGHHHGFGHHHGCEHHHGFKHHKHFGHHGKFIHHHHHEFKQQLLEMLKDLLSIETRSETGHNTPPGPRVVNETTQCTKCSGSRHWGRKHWRMFHKKPSIATSKTQTCGNVQTETEMVNQANHIRERCDESPDIEVVENIEALNINTKE